jgi:hypothetical protein
MGLICFMELRYSLARADFCNDASSTMVLCKRASDYAK